MKFSSQRAMLLLPAWKMDIFINLVDVVFGNLLAFFPSDNVIQDGQLEISFKMDSHSLDKH